MNEFIEYIDYIGDNLFEDIFDFKNEHEIHEISIFQIVIMFCEENSYHIEEIGEELRKDKKFRAMLEADLKLNNEAIFLNDKVKNNLQDWF